MKSSIIVLVYEGLPYWRTALMKGCSMKVRLDEGLPRWRSALMKVCLDEGPPRWRSALTKVRFDKGLTQQRPAPPLNNISKLDTKVIIKVLEISLPDNNTKRIIFICVQRHKVAKASCVSQNFTIWYFPFFLGLFKSKLTNYLDREY
jgi:hypothetical protein